MAKTLRINLTLEEVELLIRSMQSISSSTVKKKKERLVVRYLAQKLEFDEVEASTFDLIANAISWLTGIPQDEILPESELDDLGLTPTKKGELRAHLNDYIEKQDSDSFITEDEMSAAETVAVLNQLVESKIP